MPDTNSIDKSVIESLRDIMGDAFSMLISTFTNDTGKLVHSLSELQQQNDIEVFTRNSHSIKSSCANVGALQMSSIAAELEAQGKTGDISNVSDKVNNLQNEFEKACVELNEII